MRGVTRDTWAELIDKKFLWLYGIVTVLSCLLVVLIGQAETRIQVETGPMGGDNMVAGLASAFILKALIKLAIFFVFITVMVTSMLLPQMLERGRADFYLSKPLSRSGLLFNKLFAVWAVYGVVVTSCLGLTAGICAAVLGGVDVNVVYIIAYTWVLLAVWLSVTAFVGVSTGSTVLAIVVAFATYMLHWVLTARDYFFQMFEARWLEVPLDAIYYVLPKPTEISSLVDALASGSTVATWMPLWTSLLFALVLYVSTAFIFRAKNY